MFFDSYFAELFGLVRTVKVEDLLTTSSLIKDCNRRKGKVIIVGNGGSSAIASHFAVDLTKACGVRSINFNEAGFLTCFANDYGYENWVVEALKSHSDPTDLVFLISSSGSSKNIVNAAEWCSKSGIQTICLSGFEKDNLLQKYGVVHLWVDSRTYNHVENCHQLWLLSVIDYLGKIDDVTTQL